MAGPACGCAELDRDRRARRPRPRDAASPPRLPLDRLPAALEHAEADDGRQFRRVGGSPGIDAIGALQREGADGIAAGQRHVELAGGRIGLGEGHQHRSFLVAVSSAADRARRRRRRAVSTASAWISA